MTAASQTWSHVQPSHAAIFHAVGGLGFRGVVRPQVVGFVDIGLGEQGVAVFTGLEYPF